MNILMDDSAFSSEQLASFIVENSQLESQSSQPSTSSLLKSLTALTNIFSSKVYPKRAMPNGSGENHAAGNAGNNHDDFAGGNGNQAGDGNDGEHHENDGGGENNAGDGGGNGGDDGSGDSDAELIQDDGDSHEDGDPSSENSASSQIPALVPVPEVHANAPQLIQEQFLEQPDFARSAENVDDNAHAEDPGSGTDDGISDATTAAITDSDHQASTVNESFSPRVANNPAEISSAVSTLSSLSSTSSDERRQRRLPVRRKLPIRKQPSTKRAKHDTSSSLDTSTTLTSRSKNTTTTSSDTSHDRSHDTSHDTSADRSRDKECDKDISGSQQDMFGDERNKHPDIDLQSQQSRPGQQQDAAVEQRDIATPAAKLQSLHFSGQYVVSVADSVDTETCGSDVVLPSLETAETVPYIIPDTPTYDEVADVAAGQVIQCPKLESSSNSDSRIQFVSEWQPSVRSEAASGSIKSRSSSDSSRKTAASVQIVEQSEADTATKTRSRKSRRAVDCYDTQDLQEGVSSSSCNSSTSRAHDVDTCDDALRLQMTEAATESVRFDAQKQDSADEANDDRTQISTSSVGSFQELSDFVKGTDAKDTFELRMSQTQTQRNDDVTVMSVTASSQFEDAENDTSLNKASSSVPLSKQETRRSQPTQASHQPEAAMAADTGDNRLHLDMIHSLCDDDEDDGPVATDFKLDLPRAASGTAVRSPAKKSTSVFEKVKQMTSMQNKTSVSPGKSVETEVGNPFDFSNERDGDVIPPSRDTASLRQKRKPTSQKKKMAKAQASETNAANSKAILDTVTECEVSEQAEMVNQSDATRCSQGDMTRCSQGDATRCSQGDMTRSSPGDATRCSQGDATLSNQGDDYQVATQEYCYTEEQAEQRSHEDRNVTDMPSNELASTSQYVDGLKLQEKACGNKDDRDAGTTAADQMSNHEIEAVTNSVTYSDSKSTKGENQRKESGVKSTATGASKKPDKQPSQDVHTSAAAVQLQDTPRARAKTRRPQSSRKILHCLKDIPRSGHVLSPLTSEEENEHVKARSRGIRTMPAPPAPADPYEFRLSQDAAADPRDTVSSTTARHKRAKAKKAETPAVDMDTEPMEHNTTVSSANPQPHAPTAVTSHAPLTRSGAEDATSSSHLHPQVSRPLASSSRSTGIRWREKTIVTVIKEFRLVNNVPELVQVISTDTKVEIMPERGESSLGTPSPGHPSMHSLSSGDLGDISSISSPASRAASRRTSSGGVVHTPSLLKASSSSSAASKLSYAIIENRSNSATVSTHVGLRTCDASPIERPAAATAAATSPASIPCAQQARVTTDVSLHQRRSSSFGSGSGSLRHSRSSLETLARNSEPLFSDHPPDERERQVSRSSSSVRSSESLFSRTSSTDTDSRNKTTLFVQPGESDIPLASKRRSSTGSRKSTGTEAADRTLDSDMVPPSQPDQAVAQGHRSMLIGSVTSTVTICAGATTTDVTTVVENSASVAAGQGHEKQEKMSKAEKQTHPHADVPAVSVSSSTGNERESVTVTLPAPYWPKDALLPKDTAVLAMWRDKHWYHGHVQSCSSVSVAGRERQRYTVQFENGNTRKVKVDEIVVCELPAIGQVCYAAIEDDGSEVEAEVTGHVLADNQQHACVVQFADGSTRTLGRGCLSLNKEQVQNLVTRETARASEHDVTTQEDASVETDAEAVSSEPLLTAIKAKTAAAEDDVLTEREEPYEAAPAFLPNLTTLLSPHTPVFAKWPADKHYYPAYIMQQDARSGKYLVRFDDGDEHHLKDDELIVCELLRCGQRVLAAATNDSAYVAGSVVSHWRRGVALGYDIRFCHDDAFRRVERRQVTLSEEEAHALIDELRPACTPKPSAADVSLDHVVDGKRSRLTALRSPVKRVAMSLSASTSKAPATATSPLQLSGAASTGGKRKRRFPVEPKHTSTPTPKRKATTLHAPPNHPRVEGIVNSPAHIARSSPRKVKAESMVQGSRASPRKVKAKLELFSDVKGPLVAPHVGNIFQGMAFLLSHVEKTQEQKAFDKQLLRSRHSTELSSTEESFAEDEMLVPFDKEHLRRQLTSGGGTVLESFSRDAFSQYKTCLLISSTYQRTLKYLHCLAAGVACVSNAWVKDCCVEGKLKSHKAYLLPAGISIESNSIKECWKSRNPLQSLRVLVSSESADFVTAWTSVLEASGCQVKTSLDSGIYVVIADKQVTPDVMKECCRLDVPVVSSEWVIQCLINGRIVNPASDERYRHTYRSV